MRPTHHFILVQSDTPFSHNSTTLDLDCKYIMWKVWGTRCCHWLLPSSTLFSLTSISFLFCDPSDRRESSRDQLNCVSTIHVSVSRLQQRCPRQTFLLRPTPAQHTMVDNEDRSIYCSNVLLDAVLPTTTAHPLPGEGNRVPSLGAVSVPSYKFIITRFHEAYPSKADVKVGIQIRLYDGTVPFSDEQILSCTRRQNILPQTSQRPSTSTTTATTSRVVVVMTSLKSGYFERVRELYWENAMETGEVVAVFQPSHEEYQ